MYNTVINMARSKARTGDLDKQKYILHCRNKVSKVRHKTTSAANIYVPWWHGGGPKTIACVITVGIKIYKCYYFSLCNTEQHLSN